MSDYFRKERTVKDVLSDVVTNVLLFIIPVLILAFMAFLMWKLFEVSGIEQSKATNTCVERGYNKEYCDYLSLGL